MLQESSKQVEDIVKFLKQVELGFILLISSFSFPYFPCTFSNEYLSFVINFAKFILILVGSLMIDKSIEL